MRVGCIGCGHAETCAAEGAAIESARARTAAHKVAALHKLDGARLIHADGALLWVDRDAVVRSKLEHRRLLGSHEEDATLARSAAVGSQPRGIRITRRALGDLEAGVAAHVADEELVAHWYEDGVHARATLKLNVVIVSSGQPDRADLIRVDGDQLLLHQELPPPTATGLCFRFVETPPPLVLRDSD